MGSYKEIAVRMKKFAILSMRTIFRSVKQHPFLVGMILLLVFLYRSFPFLFSLLLSASPVLVCTAILLGTLLSFGQPNIPEIEKEEKLSQDVASLKATGVSGDNTLDFEKDESFVVEKHSEDREDLVEKSIGDAGFVDDEFHGKVENRVDSPDCVPLIDERSREIHMEKRVIKEVEREFLDFGFEKKELCEEEAWVDEGMLSHGKAVGDYRYSLVQEIGDDEIVAAEVNGPHGESVETYKEDHLQSSQQAGNYNDVGNDNEDEEDGSSYIESDRAESSSPDASMADIIPMLDQLHPLLDLEAPQPPHMSHDESDAAFEHSHGSDVDSADSDAETENHVDEVEDGADDNDDDEEEAHGGKEDKSKAAIKWTEDDQKNLMDLGTSELERNQRLENLIAKRRAQKGFRLTAERNLIELDSADLPFNVAPISTTRNNPFDLPYDSYENMGLPPIPGSAPSILLPRRNPFDLPYDPNEEKPDLKGDNFEQEFLAVHQKDILFRRHESFNVGPSGLGVSRQDTKWKPVFVPERLASEGTSYPSFQRQLSEVSESKLSSVPDTESVSSVADADEKKLAEQDFSKEAELASNSYQGSDLAEHGSEASDDAESVESEQAERRDVQHDEDVITLGRAENHHGMELELSETRDVAAHGELNTSMVHLETEPLKEEECSSKSSMSSLSEVDDRIPHVKNDDNSTNSWEQGNYVDEFVISAQSSVEESEFQFMGGIVDDNQTKEPVYDSSPSTPEKLLSLSSISSDMQVEMSEMIKPSTSTEIGESFGSLGSEVQGESVKKDTSEVNAVKEVPIESREATESREIDISKVALSADGLDDHGQIRLVVPESGPVHVSVDSVSFSLESQLEEGMVSQEKKGPDEHDLLQSSIADVEFISEMQQHEDDKIHTMASRDLMSEQHGEQGSSFVEDASVCPNLSTSETATLEKYAVVQEEIINLDQHQIRKKSEEEDIGSSNDSTAVVLEEAQPPFVVEQVSVVHPSSCSLENNYEKEDPADGKESIQFKQGQLYSSSSDAKVEANILQDCDSTLNSENKSSPELERELSMSDKSMVEPEIGDHDKIQESAATMEKTEGDSSISHEFCDPIDKVLTNLISSTCDSASIPSDPLEYKPLAGEIDLQDSMLDGIVNVDHVELSDHIDCEPKFHVAVEDIKEEVDELKDIDEGLLSELDTVGDFRVIEPVGKSVCSEMTLEEAKVGNAELEIVPSSSNQSETTSELPVLEVRSLEDIDLDFKQLHEGADVEEVILPSLVKEQLDTEESSETISDLKVVIARSLEDIQIALKQVSEGNASELPTPLKNESIEGGTISELKVVEARSVDDIQIVLNQVSEGDLGELSTPLNSKNESTQVGISEAGSTIETESGNADEPKEESHESSGTSSTRKSKSKDKKSKDRLVRSGSSSSSSCSSSSSSSESE